MKEKDFFLSLVIVGFALGVIGFSAMTQGPTGRAVANEEVMTTHSKCVNGKCVELRGPGNSECSVDDHCSHLGCKAGRCTLINSPGEDICSSNSDCY